MDTYLRPHGIWVGDPAVVNNAWCPREWLWGARACERCRPSEESERAICAFCVLACPARMQGNRVTGSPSAACTVATESLQTPRYP
jgi:hypothetical protein